MRDTTLPVLVDEDGALRLWTFAGGKANNLLGQLLQKTVGVLQKTVGGKIAPSNTAITFADGAAESEAAVRRAISDLRERWPPSQSEILKIAAACERSRISKFQPCLAAELERQLLADALLDVEGAGRALGR